MPSIIVLDTLSPDGLALLDAAKPHGITYEVVTGLSGDLPEEGRLEHEVRPEHSQMPVRGVLVVQRHLCHDGVDGDVD